MADFTLTDLAAIIKTRAAAGGEASYTRKLLDKGPVHCARKMGEEAVEAIIAATQGDRAGLVAESADVLYHLLVLLEATGIPLSEVEAELKRRTAMSGLEEKSVAEDPMNIRTDNHDAPYRVFTRDEWAALRDDTPMTLTEKEVERLHSLHDRLDINEVETIYLPLSRLLSLYVAATQRLFRAEQRFLGTEDAKVPYIIGVAGSVAVGKSTTARVLQALLARWSNTPKVSLVTTDGFLFPNKVLLRDNLMERKGFPESYDLAALLQFLAGVKAGRRPVRAPIYSHLTYDIVPDEWVEVDRPDILIVEGLNVLQTGRLPRDGKAVPVVSDFFDFSVYIDADEDVLQRWYIDRFLALRSTAFADPRSYFHRYAGLSDEEATATAVSIWTRINLANLRENILPTRPRATLILKKSLEHVVQSVALRRL